MTDRELLQSIQQQISDQLAPPPVVQPPSSGTLRLLTWNAHHGGQLSDGSKTDMVGFSNWVASFNADVCCHQEMDVASVPALLQKILLAKSPSWTSTWTGVRGNSIHSRMMSTYGALQVADDQGRGIIALATVKSGMRPIMIANVHLDGVEPTNRPKEIANALAIFRNSLLPDLWVGDFNSTPASPEYASIIAAGYDDAWIVAQSRENYPGNCDGCTKGSRIDYVFVRKASNLTVTRAAIPDTRNAAGVMPSDHKPLIVDLSW